LSLTLCLGFNSKLNLNLSLNLVLLVFLPQSYYLLIKNLLRNLGYLFQCNLLRIAKAHPTAELTPDFLSGRVLPPVPVRLEKHRIVWLLSEPCESVPILFSANRLNRSRYLSRSLV
jgi:hypothetical protein